MKRLHRAVRLLIAPKPFLAVALFSILASAASATITATGNFSGTGTPYNGTDNPWVVSNLQVGASSPGSLTINGGSIVSNGGSSGILGSSSGSSTSSVTVDGAGSQWTNTGNIQVSHAGIATLTISGGGSVSNTGSQISVGSGQGTVTVGGGSGTSTWTNSNTMTIGGSGTGTLNIIGGGAVSGTGASIGGSGAGVANVGGGSGVSTWTNTGALTLPVAPGATGTLTITGGGSVSDTSTSMASNSSAVGTVTVGGGTGASTWTNSSKLTVGTLGTATLNINTSGTVVATALDGGNATSGVNFDGGTLSVTSTDSASNTIKLLAGGGTFDVPTTGTTFTITSSITGAGALTKIGGATLTLSAGNAYGGGTTVNTGTLIVGHVSALGSGALTVNNSAVTQLQAGLSAPVQLSSLTITGGAALATDEEFEFDGTSIANQIGSPTGAAASAQAVPEPATFGLAVVGIVALAVAWQRNRRAIDS